MLQAFNIFAFAMGEQTCSDMISERTRKHFEPEKLLVGFKSTSDKVDYISTPKLKTLRRPEKCENFIIRMKAKRGKKGEKKKHRFPQRQIDNNEYQSFAYKDDRTRYFKNHCKIQNLGT